MACDGELQKVRDQINHSGKNQQNGPEYQFAFEHGFHASDESFYHKLNIRILKDSVASDWGGSYSLVSRYIWWICNVVHAKTAKEGKGRRGWVQNQWAIGKGFG